MVNSQKRATKPVCGAFVSLAVVLTFLTGCQPKSSNDANNDKNWANQKSTNLKIAFKPYFGAQELNCDTTIALHGKTWKTSELAMFMSGFSIEQKGREYALNLVENRWQSQNVTLLRQSADCKETNTNLVLLGSLSDTAESAFDPKQASVLRFTIGLPFELNHQNPVIQSSPLNDSSMFWVWRNGYKFLRWDMQTDDGDSWSFHLGSVGCQSAAMVRAPSAPCAYPNLVELSLDLSSFINNTASSKAGPLNIELRVDFAQIIGGITPQKATSCMFSSIDDAVCVELLENLKNTAVFSLVEAR